MNVVPLRSPFSNTRGIALTSCAAALAGPMLAGCGPSESSATEIEVGPATLAINGTDVTHLEVNANGSWEALAEPEWLSVEPSEGTGNETLTISADREDLEVDTYAGAVMVVGSSDVIETAPVVMRFPELGGFVESPHDNLEARRSAPERDVAALQAGEDYVPGEILVGLDREFVALQEHGLTRASEGADLEPSMQALEAAADDIGAQISARSSKVYVPSAGFTKLEVDTPDVAGAIADLRRDGRIRYAEPNEIVELEAADDEYYDLQWHYERINLEEAWEITTGYEDTVVAVIDADFHPDHPDLTDNLLPGFDFTRNTENLEVFNTNCRGHGTHVAGTVAAVAGNQKGIAGVAPSVRVLPLSNTEASGPCTMSGDGITRAIHYAAGDYVSEAGRLEEPVDVINMSFGSDSTSEDRQTAYDSAYDAGIVLITSAGNRGNPGPDDDFEPGDMTHPAVLPNVMAVSATDQFDDLASYSSYGEDVWVAAPGGSTANNIGDTDFAARVLSTSWSYPDAVDENGDRIQELVEPEDDTEEGYAYELKSGTSMASPHVAAVAGLMRSVNPDLSHSQVAEILRQTATDLGEPGHNDEFGYGLINAEAAVRVAADELRVPTDEVVVRVIGPGDQVIHEAQADAGGGFDLGPLAAGEYTVQAGSLRGGEIGAPGTVYGELTIEIDYTGDETVLVPVSAR